MCMYKRYMCLISVILLLGMVGNVLAMDIDWTNGDSDRLWRNAANWNFGVPGDGDKAAIRQGGPGPIIDSSTTAIATDIALSDWSSFGDTLDMTGGSLTTSGWFIIGYQAVNDGTFNVSGGTANIGTNLFVGFQGAGNVNITAGTITVSNTFGIAQLAGSSGNVYLNGGTISCGSLSMLTGAAMDIGGGTLIINGNITLTINSYISSGWLTAYGGGGTLAVDYNVTNPGKTTVTANSPEKASYPSPGNGTTGISMNADLSWTAGIYATSHDVYFGTDPTPDATEFQGNQPGTTFALGTLDLATTYYWRIDEVDTGDPASPWIGDVWSFTTRSNTATFKKGPYLLYPGNNTEMQIHWQLDFSGTCSLAWGLDTNYSDGNVSVSQYGTDKQYKHTITNLTPGAKYYYEITVGTGTITGSFTAAPVNSATDLKFIMYGDSRTNPADHAITAAGINAIIASDPDYQTMLLFSGDWSAQDTEASWNDEFFNRIYPSVTQTQASIPYQGCMGNHEGNGNVYRKYWPYPYVAPHYWSFDYGPIHVTVIDQYEASYRVGSAQYDWLVNDLATSSKEWKIIVLHHPGWSAAGSHPNKRLVQNVIQPLCLKYGVQIVLGGHNHYYARALVNEIHHLTSGGGGAPRYTPKSGQPYIVSYLESLNFQTIEISGDTLTCTSYRPNGTVIDTFQLNNVLPSLPGPATNPNPANSATEVAIESYLSWSAGSDATSHDVYFGTTSPGTFQGNLGSTAFDPGTLAYDTTYYWSIDEKNATGTAAGAVWSFTTGLPGPANYTATGEIAVEGSVFGTYPDTQNSNNVYESIMEKMSQGNPGDRYSYLEHKWTINVASGSTVTFFVEAHHSSNSEGDDFIFAYSTDDSTYINMLTVTKTSDDNTYQSYVLPNSISGTVYIRVVDTDQTAGRQDLDTINIDHMYIRFEITFEPPGQASNPSPADSATGVSTTAGLGWTVGGGATSHDVYFGTSSPGAFQGNQTGTIFDTGAMANSTTYYWRIDEKNGYGTTTGVVWSFTTHPICGDGACDLTNLATLGSYWLDTGCVDPTWCGNTDVDKSGDVGIDDIILLAESWLRDLSLFHWNLDETAGSVAYDTSINAYHGTLMNMDDSDWVPGKMGNALDFDGINDYVAVGSVFTGMAGKDLTVSAWMKAPALNSAMQFLISINTSSGGNRLLCGTLPNTATLSLGDTVWHDTTATVIDNTWHHIAYVLEDSSDTITIYVDGSNVLSFTSTVSLAATDILSFGQEYDAGMVISDFYSGQLDDIRIYDRPLSDAEIAVLAQ